MNQIAFLLIFNVLYASTGNCPCDHNDVIKKIDRIAKKNYGKFLFIKEVNEYHDRYVVRYYHKDSTILGAGIDAIVEKNKCKIIHLKLSQ